MTDTLLINEIKDYLRYSEDEDTTALPMYISDGKARIKSLTGTEIDYATDIYAKELLKNYVRFAVNNGAEYFEESFKAEILRLQLQEGVKSNEATG